jgi:hypothetical protein
VSGKPHEFESETPDGVQLVRVYRDDEGNWPERERSPAGYVYVYPDGALAGEKAIPAPEGSVYFRVWVIYHPDDADNFGAFWHKKKKRKELQQKRRLRKRTVKRWRRKAAKKAGYKKPWHAMIPGTDIFTPKKSATYKTEMLKRRMKFMALHKDWKGFQRNWNQFRSQFPSGMSPQAAWQAFQSQTPLPSQQQLQQAAQQAQQQAQQYYGLQTYLPLEEWEGDEYGAFRPVRSYKKWVRKRRKKRGERKLRRVRRRERRDRGPGLKAHLYSALSVASGKWRNPKHFRDYWRAQKRYRAESLAHGSRPHQPWTERVTNPFDRYSTQLRVRAYRRGGYGGTVFDKHETNRRFPLSVQWIGKETGNGREVRRHLRTGHPLSLETRQEMTAFLASLSPGMEEAPEEVREELAIECMEAPALSEEDVAQLPAQLPAQIPDDGTWLVFGVLGLLTGIGFIL